MRKKKYYVVWQGRRTGVFSSWSVCKKHIDGFKNAKFKAFINKEEAELAFTKSYNSYISKITKKATLTEVEKRKYGSPILDSISVDAACSGNPGKMEYRGVLTNNKKPLFGKGPFENATNNIGEFLALVHGIAFLKDKKMGELPIYSDSKVAMSWVRQKKCKTNVKFTEENKNLQDLIFRAEKWLEKNSFKNPILKWETKVWGEIPADFGRK